MQKALFLRVVFVEMMEKKLFLLREFRSRLQHLKDVGLLPEQPQQDW